MLIEIAILYMGYKIMNRNKSPFFETRLYASINEQNSSKFNIKKWIKSFCRYYLRYLLDDSRGTTATASDKTAIDRL